MDAHSKRTKLMARVRRTPNNETKRLSPGLCGRDREDRELPHYLRAQPVYPTPEKPTARDKFPVGQEPPGASTIW